MMELNCKKPRVSFVMPAYNASEFIGVAIESVLAQTVSDWELVIVNDGSTDDTVTIVEQYIANDTRIRLLNMPKASGAVYQPRKMAIENSLAEFVSPLDADDFVERDYLEKLFKRRDETGAGLIYPTMYKKQIGRSEWELLIPNPGTIGKLVLCGRDVVKYTLDEWQINCNGGLIEKSIFLSVFAKYDSTLSYTFADEFLGRQIQYEAKVVAFSDAKYFYRTNENSITHKKSLKLFDVLKSNQLLYDFILEKYRKDELEYKLIQRHVFHGVVGCIRQLNKNKYTYKERKYVYSLIKQNVSLFDWALLKSVESYIYYYHMRLFHRNLELARLTMRIGDALHRV